MTILDILFLVALSAASLCLFVCVMSVVGMISTRKKIRTLEKKRFKNKKKRKRVRRTIQQYAAKRKKQMIRMIVFFLGSIVLVGGAVYAIYYQSTHLFEQDSAEIVKGYYAVENLDKEFISAESSDNEVKTGKNIKTLAAQMASTGNRKASTRNTKEGQKILNQYYKSLRELGVNISAQSDDFFMNQQRFDPFKKDLENIKKNQKAVFDYFGVNESAFKEKQQ